MKENKIKKAAELLLKGSKMLNIACPVCDNPIYEMKDHTMYCVNCEKNVVKENNLEETQKNYAEHSIHTKNDPIQMKIEQLGISLLNEVDYDKIVEIAELIAKLKKINS